MRPRRRSMPGMLLGSVLVIALGCAQAQAPSPMPVEGQAEPQPVLVPPRDPPVPLLWKVSDADNAVYLLGSFHLLKPDDYPLSNDVNRAFADARTVVFELPPEEMNSPQLPLQMMQAAVRTDGSQLDSELPAETVAKLNA